MRSPYRAGSSFFRASAQERDLNKKLVLWAQRCALICERKIDEILLTMNGLSKETTKAVIRYAPAYTPGRVVHSTTRPYSQDSVAKFLGWTISDGHAQKKVGTACNKPTIRNKPPKNAGKLKNGRRAESCGKAKGEKILSTPMIVSFQNRLLSKSWVSASTNPATPRS
jgi:hypothetical protein